MESAVEPSEAVGVEVEYRNGFTWRALIAAVYAAVVFLPAYIFMTLLTGGYSIGYTGLLFFVAVASIFGSPLTKQEGWTIQMLTASIINPVALTVLQNAYGTRLSPEIMRFTTPEGPTLPYVTPDWFAPPLGSPAYLYRTFLNPAWLIPVAISASTFALAVLTDVALGFMMYQLYAVEEKLPFPMQHVDAQAVITLSEKEPRRATILYISAMIGFIYSFLLYFFPVATGFAAMGPIPFADSTRYFELWFPGAILGLATDVSNFLLAFIVSPMVIVNMFIGSIAVYVVGNALLVRMYPSAPAGLFGWRAGMPSQQIALWSSLYVWFGPVLGVTIIAAIYPMLRHPRAVASVFMGMRSLTRIARGKGMVSLNRLLIMYIVGGVAYVAIASWLVPSAPIWVFIFLSIVWPFLNAVIQTRSLGETTVTITVPYLQQALYLTSTQGTAVWFAPVNPSRGAGWAAAFKTCELTQTRMKSFVVAVCIAYLIGGALSYAYVEMLWKVAPIPEGWSYSALFWPLSATTSALWITRSIQFVRPEGIFGGLGVGLVLAVLGDLAHLPISLISIAVGMTTWPHYVISYMVGLIIYKILERRIGKEWMQANRVTIVAGFAVGGGLAITVAAFWGLTGKAMFTLPF